MMCAQCQGWMLEERRVDFSPDTFYGDVSIAHQLPTL